MKIINAELFTYRLPLTRPLKLKNATITERRGCLLKLAADSGAIGWGEAAPLPGFSVETFDDTTRQLAELSNRLIGLVPTSNVAALWGRLHSSLEVDTLAPSAQCAIEMALLNLLAADAGISLAEILTDHPADEVLMNGLITDDEDVSECTRRLKHLGYRTVKLKVGRGEVADDIERTRLACRELGNNIALRLDANRVWSFDDAIRFAGGVADCRIEYIEEPLSDPTRLSEFSTMTNIPIALDESLALLTPDNLSEHKYAAAVVLKPTFLGGFEKSSAYARVARELGVTVVISSAFESGIGIAALTQFAAAVGQPGVTAGLDTLGWFVRDLLVEPIDCSGGRMSTVQVGRAARSVNETALMKCSRQLPVDLVRFNGAFSEDTAALIDGDFVMSWRDVESSVCQLDKKLRDLNVKPGDRVAVVENNRIELAILVLACIRLGAVAVLVSPRFPEAARVAMIKSVGGRGLTEWDHGLHNDELTKSSSVESDGVRTDEPIYAADQPATIFFTSGSTGLPKAVLHSVGNHYYNALGSNAILPVGPSDRWLLSLPLYHVGGVGILFRCLLSRGAVVFERRGVELTEQIVQDRITHLSLVPTQLHRLLRHPDLSRARSSLKAILLGGGPIPSDLLKQASDAGLPVFSTYGLTEMASQVATASPNSPDKPRVLPYREVRITDHGTICVRGHTLFLGYVTPQGIDRPLDADGWFHTGDIGRIDSSGYLHVSGRKDNMFISGGENIHPEQIEAALGGIEGIEDALVVPVDDTDYGRRPVAFLRYRADFNLSETESDLSEETRFGFDHHSLSAELEKTLPRYMLPIVYYPWPHGYAPAGIKHDRSFFRNLADKLHRNKR